MSTNGEEEPKASEILLQATTRAGLPEGDPLDAVIQAVLTAQSELFANAIKKLAPPVAHHAEDVELVRAEIAHLVQTVRGVGESITKVERRWSLVGETLATIENRVKALNEVTTTFAGVARHQLWWLCAAVFAAGALGWPLFDLVIGYIRGLGHS